ncbi:hypothetical protein LTR10_022373 [Elasticomyces elasticus]|uniref:Uncharacterized protein n=1 Tax=Exophiala sideris TaxID=1016849 RepID=A0ABR0J7G3_9EURO|nr:hypothetical protein LTR10_022373 [Elasticomyces elasticus]KAK5029557.1 hypothetical protein LTS07_006020 [Exophiala sideris]KAK5036750.1 hypothetical protein LTR13_005130 [Exophiala sideris]KAK5058186.1 hypothetical protein LTR69_007184 [Exophiala sideris]KAK5182146.1 hypothetical protein LTR44_005747 [Eurotiomycetes sp. CCFEE 6388]
MAEVAVKKRGRPKKVAVDDEVPVVVGVLEATTADEPKTRGKAASPTSSLAKKSTSTSKAAITTSTTTSSTAAKKVKVLAEDKKVTASTTGTTPAKKRAVRSSSPNSASASSAINTDPVEKAATTPTLEPEKVEGLVVEAKTSTTGNQKFSAEKEPATTTTTIARSATTTTTTTPTVVKKTRIAPSAVKAEASPLPIPASAQSERQVQNQARLSKILQQARSFSKHSDELHRSLLELVGDREVAYVSVLQGLETQTGKPVYVSEIEVLASSESPVAAVTATPIPAKTAPATSTSTTVPAEPQLQQEKPKQNQDQKSTETTTISAGQNEKGPEAPIKPKVTLEELVALVEAAVSAPSPPTAAVSQAAPEAETIATVNQPALTPKATPDETTRQPPAIAPTVYIPSASMPLPSPQAWWSRPIPRYVLPASTITALAARGINTTNIQRQQPPSSPDAPSSGPSFPKRAGAGAGIGAGAGGFGAGGVSLPPSRAPPPPIQPKRPSEMPLKELKKDPKYRLLSSRWTRIMVALPVAIVSSYVLWERYEEQQAYRRAKEAKDRLERLGLGTSESNPYK